MGELISLVLTLQPLENPAGRNEFPRWWGRAAQAFLLDLARERDPALAERLHGPAQAEGANQPRPYTVSTLMGHFKKDGAPQVTETYSLRLTSLTEEVADLLRAYAANAAQSTVELDHLPFRVLAAVDQTADQPWAGSASYASLGAQFLPGVEVARRVTFQFTSPVVFKSGGLSQPLPSPALIFNSLLERWNAFAPLTFAPEVRRYVDECLAVSRFELKSRAVPLKEGGLRIGAVGRLTLTATHPDKFWLGQVQTLAAFAQYAGLGQGSTQGLGQCRMLNLE
jgi:CRISPR-associated endoribonuclease Cas6